MTIVPSTEIPDEILKDSMLTHLAAAYFSVGKRLERKTRCSPLAVSYSPPCVTERL
jgi:hypothetical protein